MNIIIAIVALIVGLLVGIVGFLFAADPEGRGGLRILLLPAGAVVALGAVIYLFWLGLRALIGG